jgi:hypothetical protein
MTVISRLLLEHRAQHLVLVNLADTAEGKHLTNGSNSMCETWDKGELLRFDDS